jgi:hypothetical protein
MDGDGMTVSLGGRVNSVAWQFPGSKSERTQGPARPRGAPILTNRSVATKPSDLLRRSRGRRGGWSLRRRWGRRLSATCRRSRSWCFPSRFPEHTVDQGAVVFAVVPLRLNHDQDGNDHDQDEKNPHSNTLPISRGRNVYECGENQKGCARLPPRPFSRAAVDARASQSAPLRELTTVKPGAR